MIERWKVLCAEIMETAHSLQIRAMMNKRGNVMNTLTSFALGLVIFAVVIAVGLVILSKLSTTLTGYVAAKNAVDTIINSIGEIPGWISIIIIAVIGGSVIFLLFKSFSGKQD